MSVSFDTTAVAEEITSFVYAAEGFEPFEHVSKRLFPKWLRRAASGTPH